MVNEVLTKTVLLNDLARSRINPIG